MLILLHAPDDYIEFDNFSLLSLPAPIRPPAGAGTHVIFEPCAPGSQSLSSHQGWDLVPDSDITAVTLEDSTAHGQDELYTIRPSVDKKLCVDWRDPTQLKTQPCASSEPPPMNHGKQMWNTSLSLLRGASGAFIRAAGMTSCSYGSGGNPIGGCCMEVAGNLAPPGTAADIYACEESSGAACANEVFRMVMQDGLMRLVASSTGFCLTTA